MERFLLNCVKYVSNNRHVKLGFLIVFCSIWFVLGLFVVREKRLNFLDIYKWTAATSTFCGGNYIGYGNMFFRLGKTIYNPVNDVFTISCQSSQHQPNDYWIRHHYAPFKYSKSLVCVREDIVPAGAIRNDHVTMVVHRENPHNFYHAMTQWYNMYLVSKIINVRWQDLHVLLLDRGPFVQIDEHWKLLFPKVTKAKELTSNLSMKDAVFNLPGPISPMYRDSLHTLPYIEEFSDDFLSRFNLNNDKRLDCSNLTITLVTRRDYFFHPEKDGIKRNTQRKFKNEEELVHTLRSLFAGHELRIMISEFMSLRQQLELVVQTDIFIAMHGCSLTHTLFLPGHATFLELYPVFWTRQPFFSSIANWRGLRFEQWHNKAKKNEFPDHYTRIPPQVLVDYAAIALTHLGCTETMTISR